MSVTKQVYLEPVCERIPLLLEQNILDWSNPGGGGSYSGDQIENGDY